MVIARFYRKNWMVITQMISAIHVLNFNRLAAGYWKIKVEGGGWRADGARLEVDGIGHGASGIAQSV